MSSPTARTGRLWVVATPIGNLGDLSQRARYVLSRAEVVLAEDTRRAGLLFQQLDIDPPHSFLSLHEHNESGRLRTVLAHLSQGRELALISSAGTPLVSDPGYRLVRECHRQGFPVEPVPGPSAPMAALMASGLPPQPHTFLGFMPRRQWEQRRLLSPFAEVRTTLIFFERKSRIRGTLKTAYDCLGAREVCLARELTKSHEEFILMLLGEWEKIPSEPRGEFTVLLGPPVKEAEPTPEHEVRQILEQELARGDKPKRLAERVVSRVRGWSKKGVYDLYLCITDEDRANGSGGSKT
ncbi:MAG: 16S rRNA (cytidine(1402)-2'-O)-methyltransferase [Desulfohalobiaceae bacterium]